MMLINEPRILLGDPIMSMIAKLNGNDAQARQQQTGIYMVGHHGSSAFLDGYDRYPDLGKHDPYGVCDSAGNLMEVLGDVLNAPDRQFVVTLTSVKREAQEPEGGWRWHKWGKYIGKHDPQCEYLYDEVGIDEVFCYHVYEKKA